MGMTTDSILPTPTVQPPAMTAIRDESDARVKETEISRLPCLINIGMRVKVNNKNIEKEAKTKGDIVIYSSRLWRRNH